jgi:hypothetical protein
MKAREIESLGEPDLQIAGLRIWVHGREFADAADYWDGNWLRATAYCIYPESTVRVHGSFVRTSEIAGLLRGAEQLYESLEGSAALECLEPNLRVQLNAKTGGHLELEINITPDQLNESHRFTDEIDQTYLPQVISACRRILERFPVRDAERSASERAAQQDAAAVERPASLIGRLAFWRRTS